MSKKTSNSHIFIKIFLFLLLVINIHLFLLEPQAPILEKSSSTPIVPVKEGRSFMEKPVMSEESVAMTSSTSSFVGKEFSRESIAKSIY